MEEIDRSPSRCRLVPFDDVPIAEAEQFYIALKDVGVPTVMVRYPREGHGLRETKHIADAMERSMAWYDRWFKTTQP